MEERGARTVGGGICTAEYVESGYEDGRGGGEEGGRGEDVEGVESSSEEEGGRVVWIWS